MGKYSKFMTCMAMSCMALTMVTGCGNEDSAGGGNTASGDTIKIGLNYEQEGDVAQYGFSHIDGIKMAVEEINANGGVLGKQIELVQPGHNGTAPDSMAVSEKLAKEGVVAILGPATTDNTIAAFNTAGTTKIPTISASATADATTLDQSGNTVPYGFKICFSDSFQGEVLAQFAKMKEFSKVGVIYNNSDTYGQGIYDAFVKSAEENNVEIVATESFTSDDSDFNAQLTRLKGQDMQALVVLGYYESDGLIVKQARGLGIDLPILGPDGFDDSRLLELAGSTALTNVFFSTHFTTVGDDPVVQKFVTDFEAKYGTKPNAFNALGYDAAYFLVDAIERAQEANSEKIKQALETTESFSKVTGTFSMGTDHVAKKSVKVVELKDGVQIDATTIEPK